MNLFPDDVFSFIYFSLILLLLFYFLIHGDIRRTFGRRDCFPHHEAKATKVRPPISRTLSFFQNALFLLQFRLGLALDDDNERLIKKEKSKKGASFVLFSPNVSFLI